MSLYNDASLAMIPSAVKDGKLYSIRPTDGSGDFTFSRGSNLAATRVDVNGLIEKGRENLLLQSNQFDTTWATTDSSVTSAQVGYDGNDAWLLDITSGSSNQNIRQVISQSGVQTFSVYLKAGSLSWAALGVDGSAVYCNLSNGTIGTTIGDIDSQVESVGNGWYRFSLTFSNSITYVRIYLASSDGSTTQSSGNIYIQDAQLEVGLVATDYIESTTTTAVSGITEDLPRLDYSGGASCPSLLLEPQRTNLNVFSEDFSNANWDKLNVVTTNYINQVVSPDGYTNADLAIPDTTSNSYHGFQLGSGRPSLTAGTVYTYSIFAKANGYSKIRVQNFSLEVRAQFDLSTGTLINQSGTTSTFITPYGNGWYRVGFTYTQATTISAYWNALVVSNDDNTGNAPVAWAGNGTSSVAFWGSTIEEGSYPSSYVPTYGSAVTRSKDAMNNSSLGLTDCTFFVDFVPLSSVMGLLDFYDNSNARIFYIAIDAVKYLTFNSVQGGTIGQILGPLTIGDRMKLAFTLNASNGDVTIFINGTKYSTYSTTISSLNKILQVASFGYFNNTEFNQIISFPTILTDSECIALTTL